MFIRKTEKNTKHIYIPHEVEFRGCVHTSRESLYVTVKRKTKYCDVKIEHDFCFGPARIQITKESILNAGDIIGQYYLDNESRMHKNVFTEAFRKHSLIGSGIYDHCFTCLKGDEDEIIERILGVLVFENGKGDKISFNDVRDDR